MNSYIQQLRKRKLGPTSISLGQLEQWCTDHNIEPNGEDEAFVIDYEIKEDETGEESGFRVCISTKRLLLHVKDVNHLCSDATYKLNYEGLPVLIIGTTDSDRHFHPISINICSDEKTASFQFIFGALLKKCPSLSPSFLISDASNAIREGFSLVFGQCTLLMCWAHFRRNVIKNIHLVDKSKHEELLGDIDSLQLSSDDKVFEKAKQLFVRKYKETEPALIEYLTTIWFTSHSNWYEGASHQLPSTNNALESFNLVIKQEETLRKRMPLGQFLGQSLASASRWSIQYTMDKVITTSPTIELCDWTEGYHWAKNSKEVKSKQFREFTEFYCPSNDQLSISTEDIKRVKRRLWSSFEQFKERAFKLWIVQMNEQDWTSACCTCPSYLKKYKCKHVIGVAIRLKYTKPPPTAKQTPIGQKRKRGRPKKVTKALIID